MDPFAGQFEQLVLNSTDRFHVPGITFAVIDGDKSWSKGYGQAQIAERKPSNPSTLYYVGSTTKAQLCAAWIIYIDSDANKDVSGVKKITLSTPLSDIIRNDFVTQDHILTSQITLEDAMSHRTGQHSHDDSYGYPGVRTSKALVRNLRNLDPIIHTFRSQFEYNNTMYVAVSHALEVVTGKALGEVLREYFWKPLGMHDTFAGHEEALDAVKSRGLTLAYGYTWSKMLSDDDPNSGEQLCDGHMIFPEVAGAGYVISTANDYLKWMRCWLSDSQPLSSELRKELWKPRIVDFEPSIGPYDGVTLYALGWWKNRAYGKDVFFHTGGLLGAGAFVMLIPELDWGLTFFSNAQACSVTMIALAWYLLEVRIGLSHDELISNYHSRNDQVIADLRSSDRKYFDARDHLYPGAPRKPEIPHALPLDAYTEHYHNPGYGTIKLQIQHDEQEDFLLCLTDDRTWPRTIHFAHVNAEHWFCTIWFGNSPKRDGTKAQTVIGADGKVEALHLSFGLEMLAFKRQ